MPEVSTHLPLDVKCFRIKCLDIVLTVAYSLDIKSFEVEGPTKRVALEGTDKE